MSYDILTAEGEKMLQGCTWEGAGLLIEKEKYLKHVGIIESAVSENQEYFPAPPWIRVLLCMEERHKMARTGLTECGSYRKKYLPEGPLTVRFPPESREAI